MLRSLQYASHAGYGYYVTDRIQVNTNGSHCNDLNIHTSSLYHISGCIKYQVNIYDSAGNYDRNSGEQWLCRYPKRWKVLTYNLSDDESYQIIFFGKVTSFILAD